VSPTRQTTDAAISIGLPDASLTFERGPLEVAHPLGDGLAVDAVSGFVHHRPASRTDPT
jgi:hypothetical protein